MRAGRTRLLAACVVTLGAAMAPLLAPGTIAAALAQSAQLAPPPPGLARVWFLRQFQPEESLWTPMIYVNGASMTPSVLERALRDGLDCFDELGIDIEPLVPGPVFRWYREN